MIPVPSYNQYITNMFPVLNVKDDSIERFKSVYGSLVRIIQLIFVIEVINAELYDRYEHSAFLLDSINNGYRRELPVATHIADNSNVSKTIEDIKRKWYGVHGFTAYDEAIFNDPTELFELMNDGYEF